MPVKINYKSDNFNKISSNLVLFTDEKFNIITLKKYISKFEFSYINDLLKTSDLKMNLLVFELSSKKKIILVSLKNNILSSDLENLGAEFFVRINYGKNSEYLINLDSIAKKYKSLAGHFLHGIKLKSYEFNKYKSKKKIRHITLNVAGDKNKLLNVKNIRFKALEEGIFFCKRFSF